MSTCTIHLSLSSVSARCRYELTTTLRNEELLLEPTLESVQYPTSMNFTPIIGYAWPMLNTSPTAASEILYQKYIKRFCAGIAEYIIYSIVRYFFRSVTCQIEKPSAESARTDCEFKEKKRKKNRCCQILW